jgi:hypothetical protein
MEPCERYQQLAGFVREKFGAATVDRFDIECRRRCAKTDQSIVSQIDFVIFGEKFNLMV